VGVNVDAARRFAKDDLPSRLGVIGEVGGIADADARRRLAIDEVRDWVFILRTGAIVGAAYISGILGTGGAFTGVVKVDGVQVLSVGIDFLALLIKLIVGRSYLRVLAGDKLLVAPRASAVPKFAVAPCNRAISSQSVSGHMQRRNVPRPFSPRRGDHVVSIRPLTRRQSFYSMPQVIPR
jgi:hypothetical protein